MESLVINKKVRIPFSDLHFRFSRSGGPGGQNVNRVSTKVELIFDVRRSSLDAETKENIISSLAHKLSSDGTLRIVSQESRSQWKNRQNAIQKLTTLLATALRPVKHRQKTAATKSSQEARLTRKKERSGVKKLRSVDIRKELE
ncbi:MAG TPA: alternative ribosome rescue aminoacyl-tRNA hydrolase ArfB [Bacteroidota bacterium]|nr:alternative ribosome rescue aminoacyl-tRNA hydrolase ArfB [Bacteroidota bacterium]